MKIKRSLASRWRKSMKRKSHNGQSRESEVSESETTSTFEDAFSLEHHEKDDRSHDPLHVTMLNDNHGCYTTEQEKNLDGKQVDYIRCYPSGFEFYTVCVAAMLLQRKWWILYTLIQLVLVRYEVFEAWLQCLLRRKPMHYFWGCRSACQIYVLCMAALVLERPWILYGVLLIFVRKVFELLLVWGLHVVTSKDVDQFITNSSCVFKLALREAEKIIKGKQLRRLLAGSAVQMWNKMGRSYVSHFLRTQMNELNHGIVAEIREKVDRADQLSLLQY